VPRQSRKNGKQRNSRDLIWIFLFLEIGSGANR